MTNVSNRKAKPQGLGLGSGSPWYIHEVTSHTGLIDVKTGEIEVFNPSEKINSARRERYKLMDISAKTLLSFHGSKKLVNVNGHEINHRTCKCHRVALTPTTQILKSEDNNKAFFGGVMQCASVWTCPVCAAKINERKASDMRDAFKKAPDLGFKCHLVTFTAPHTAGDTIEELSTNMREALAAFWRERQIAKWKKTRSIVGNIRAFEIRHGDNGWHPHFHLIVFSKDSIADDKELLLEKWQRVCLRSGLDQPNEYGLDIQDGSKAGEYICKFGSDGEVLERADGKDVSWDAADEMTKGHTKKGKSGSLSPWDILRKIDESPVEEANKYRGLFLHYARALKGVSQLKWSRGLRSLFDQDKEKTDEEILSEQEDSAKLICHLEREEWNFLIQNKMRATILELTENGGVEAVARFLYESFYLKKRRDLLYESFYEELRTRHKAAIQKT
jgi:hypothetical protein